MWAYNPLLLLLSILLPFTLLINPSHSDDSCGIAVTWGTNSGEGKLGTACATGLYKFVTIGFVSTFGLGQTPVLDLGGHCDPASGGCTSLANEILYCQSQGIKVLLSIGGPKGNYGLSDPEDARSVADNLWNTYLSGLPGPFGNATLDGIDLHIQSPTSAQYWDVLVKALAAFRTPKENIFLSASPGCIYPDSNLDSAIKTNLLNYVWVRFYDSPLCDYSGGGTVLAKAWNTWSQAMPLGGYLFMGLPASQDAAKSGYIEPTSLVTKVLPIIRTLENYGGIMLWNRFYDMKNAYSQNFNLSSVCPSTVTHKALLSQVV